MTFDWRASLGTALLAEYDVSSGYTAGSVATLVDITGNGNSLKLYPTSGGSAVWSASSQNGKPGITLGSSSYFESDNALKNFPIGTTAGPNPAAAVGMVLTKTGNSQYARLAAYVGANSGSTNDYSVVGNAIFAYDDGSGKIGVANASLSSNDAPMSASVPHSLLSQFTGAKSQVFVDTVAPVENSYTSTNFSSPGNLYFGGAAGGSEGCIISAGIVVSRAMTSDESTAWIAEMQSKWVAAAPSTPTGTAAGTSTASAVALSSGLASGTSTAAAASVLPPTGTASGTSTATGGGAAIASAAGTTAYVPANAYNWQPNSQFPNLRTHKSYWIFF